MCFVIAGVVIVGLFASIYSFTSWEQRRFEEKYGGSGET